MEFPAHLMRMCAMVVGLLSGVSTQAQTTEIREVRTVSTCSSGAASETTQPLEGIFLVATFENRSQVRLAIHHVTASGSSILLRVIAPGESISVGGHASAAEKYLAVDPDGRCVGGILGKRPDGDVRYQLHGDDRITKPGVSSLTLTSVGACPAVVVLDKVSPLGVSPTVTLENRTAMRIDVISVQPNGDRIILRTLNPGEKLNAGGQVGKPARFLAKTPSGMCVGGLITPVDLKDTSVALAANLGNPAPASAAAQPSVINQTVSDRQDCPVSGSVKSARGSGSHALAFINRTGGKLAVVWIHYDGSRTTPADLPAGSAVSFGGFGGKDQVYLVVDQNGRCFGGSLKPTDARLTQYTLQ